MSFGGDEALKAEYGSVPRIKIMMRMSILKRKYV